MTIDLNKYIRNVPDFPKPGINFKDVSPLLGDPRAFSFAVRTIKNEWAGKIDAIAGLDARGFIFGAALAFAMNIPFVMLRKKGKLPGDTVAVSYDLEYGKAVLEAEKDAFPLGSRVLIVDDLLATGGTAAAACEIVKRSGARVAGCAFIVELAALKGKAKLPGLKVQTLVTYEE